MIAEGDGPNNGTRAVGNEPFGLDRTGKT
jgi:hypothetical protein